MIWFYSFWVPLNIQALLLHLYSFFISELKKNDGIKVSYKNIKVIVSKFVMWEEINDERCECS